MPTIHHKTFAGSTFYWRGTLLGNREKIRAQAEAFVKEVGVENVVSITEHAMTFGPFSVVVWYRSNDEL